MQRTRRLGNRCNSLDLQRASFGVSRYGSLLSAADRACKRWCQFSGTVRTAFSSARGSFNSLDSQGHGRHDHRNVDRSRVGDRPSALTDLRSFPRLNRVAASGNAEKWPTPVRLWSVGRPLHREVLTRRLCGRFPVASFDSAIECRRNDGSHCKKGDNAQSQWPQAHSLDTLFPRTFSKRAGPGRTRVLLLCSIASTDQVSRRRRRAALMRMIYHYLVEQAQEPPPALTKGKSLAWLTPARRVAAPLLVMRTPRGPSWEGAALLGAWHWQAAS